jgi:hypothetical protein
MRSIAIATFSSLVLACGGGSGDDGDDSPNVDAATNPDADIPPGYTRLIGRTWTLDAGATDTYKCVRVTIPEDMYITSIMAQAPNGTHHTVLSIAGGNGTSGPDGEQDCQVGTLGMQMLYASGVGTDVLDFPTDVGIRIAAGQQVHLNLHLYNTDPDNQITGDSAILVKAQSTPPPILAEMVFAGNIFFGQYIPANEMPVEMVGGCTTSSAFSLFAVWPHMHQIAVHQKFEIIRGGGQPMVLHDQPYSFLEQTYYLQNPIFEVQSGDEIRVTCTFVNDTGSPVTWGDSSDAEMCFAGMYRYPATSSSLFECTNNPGF